MKGLRCRFARVRREDHLSRLQRDRKNIPPMCSDRSHEASLKYHHGPLPYARSRRCGTLIPSYHSYGEHDREVFDQAGHRSSPQNGPLQVRNPGPGDPSHESPGEGVIPPQAFGSSLAPLEVKNDVAHTCGSPPSWRRMPNQTSSGSSGNGAGSLSPIVEENEASNKKRPRPQTLRHKSSVPLNAHTKMVLRAGIPVRVDTPPPAVPFSSESDKTVGGFEENTMLFTPYTTGLEGIAKVNDHQPEDRTTAQRMLVENKSNTVPSLSLPDPQEPPRRSKIPVPKSQTCPLPAPSPPLHPLIIDGKPVPPQPQPTPTSNRTVKIARKPVPPQSQPTAPIKSAAKSSNDDEDEALLPNGMKADHTIPNHVHRRPTLRVAEEQQPSFSHRLSKPFDAQARLRSLCEAVRLSEPFDGRARLRSLCEAVLPSLRDDIDAYPIIPDYMNCHPPEASRVLEPQPSYASANAQQQFAFAETQFIMREIAGCFAKLDELRARREQIAIEERLVLEHGDRVMKRWGRIWT